ncbi:MAG: chemotaxis protein CheC [Clostridia bacterium]|nr:chemotaxis protein CheC [Clostridia bacterium]
MIDPGKYFTSEQIDMLGEVMNISMGSSASAASVMLGKRVDITTPTVKVMSEEHFDPVRDEYIMGVTISYVEGISGRNVLLLKRNDVRCILECMMGMELDAETFEVDEMGESAVCELMNQMLGSSSTAMSQFLNMTVNISTPTAFTIEDSDAFKKEFLGEDVTIVDCDFGFKIEDKSDSSFCILMSLEMANVYLEKMKNIYQ